MKVEYKLIFVDRKTRKPAMQPESVSPQFTVDIDELHRTNNIVNPAQGMAAMMSEDMDKRALVESTAQAFAEFYGADVYFRTEGAADWRTQRNLW